MVRMLLVAALILWAGPAFADGAKFAPAGQARDSLIEHLRDLGETFPGPSQTPAADVEGFSIIVQRGRLDIADPSPQGPYRYNRINDDLPQRVGELTQALTDLVESIRGDNNFLNEILKRQLLVLLETTASELKAPYADTRKIRAVAKTLRNVAESAVSKGAERFLADKFINAADGLVGFAKDLL